MWPVQNDSIVESSCGSAAPVATTLYLTAEPFSTEIAPSMRGWMFAEPGVAMNSATLPEGTSALIFSPIC